MNVSLNIILTKINNYYMKIIIENDIQVLLRIIKLTN